MGLFQRKEVTECCVASDAQDTIEAKRNGCKSVLESFELWSRRIINEKFAERYGKDYFSAENDNGDMIIKKEIIRLIDSRIAENPSRFPRRIDAILMDDIEYFFCKDEFYRELFRDILEPYFSGQDELRSRLSFMVDVRNKLYHGNPVSEREQERAVCYAHDFIESYQIYYRSAGKEKEYNVPFFIKAEDSFGRCQYITDGRIPDLSSGQGILKLRPGDEYKVWVEVDSNFSSDFYEIKWFIDDEFVGSGNLLTVIPTVKMVSRLIFAHCSLITKREWHKYTSCDDTYTVTIGEVLPPIEDTF